MKACGVGLQSCGYGWVASNHLQVGACDGRADGYGLSVQYLLRNGGSGFVNDGNGSASGCGLGTPGTTSNPVVNYRVCSNQANQICSPYPGWWDV